MVVRVIGNEHIFLGPIQSGLTKFHTIKTPWNDDLLQDRDPVLLYEEDPSSP